MRHTNRFASEWWYFTGHVRDESGRRFGYELTFLSVGLRPGDAKAGWAECFGVGMSYHPAHFAITDEAREQAFVYYERFAREALGRGLLRRRGWMCGMMGGR